MALMLYNMQLYAVIQGKFTAALKNVLSGSTLLGSLSVLRTKWRNTIDWKDTEHYPHHQT